MSVLILFLDYGITKHNCTSVGSDNMQIYLYMFWMLLDERGSDGVETADTCEGGRRGVVTSCLKTSVHVSLVCLACLHILSLKTQ